MERPHPIVEAAGRPDPNARVMQEINLCHWDRFIEVVGEQMEKDRAFVKDPKNSYMDIQNEWFRRTIK